LGIHPTGFIGKAEDEEVRVEVTVAEDATVLGGIVVKRQ